MTTPILGAGRCCYLGYGALEIIKRAVLMQHHEPHHSQKPVFGEEESGIPHTPVCMLASSHHRHSNT